MYTLISALQHQANSSAVFAVIFADTSYRTEADMFTNCFKLLASSWKAPTRVSRKLNVSHTLMVGCRPHFSKSSKHKSDQGEPCTRK